MSSSGLLTWLNVTLVRINVNGVNTAVLDSESPEVRVLVGSEVQEKFVTAEVDYLVSKIIPRNPELKKQFTIFSKIINILISKRLFSNTANSHKSDSGA